ncbi:MULTISPECIES: hypothetical protein [unclassified Spirosoma]|uniref:hypothetical protein n=1 Tax=unclassified Spirosoma TaxID=2621999 RepID=UPI000961948C|nr:MULTISPECIES: hypothetical protein [unclassified Spirosoma]MBN8821126.1 hypothetical protein [Spirosoma sp.]OJW79239.1 MAG: hypothetical protein BGO59_11895 [Spirosoma sp. 48-14]
MIDAPALITLIESTDPNDSSALDTLDLHVSYFLGHSLPMRYTRSRDVLKGIRPEGFLVKIENWPTHTSVLGCFVHETGQVTTFESGSGPTEELSELHVIIQAIAHLRSQPMADQ